MCAEALSVIACSLREDERRSGIACFNCVPRKCRQIGVAYAQHAESLTVVAGAFLDSECVVDRASRQLVPELDAVTVDFEDPAGDTFIRSGGAPGDFEHQRDLGTQAES
jgi:hypothetical protein